MARWLERKENWLKNENRSGNNNLKERSAGRPANGSDDYGVKFIPLKCPKCGSKDIRCYSSHPPVRYHICNHCGHNFKSIEEESDK